MIRYLALAAALTLCATTALADEKADDSQWIGQCVLENKEEGQTADVVTKYCTCMNNEMSEDETQTVTEWEKANPAVMEKCSKESGWTKK